MSRLTHMLMYIGNRQRERERERERVRHRERDREVVGAQSIINKSLLAILFFQYRTHNNNSKQSSIRTIETILHS